MYMLGRLLFSYALASACGSRSVATTELQCIAVRDAPMLCALVPLEGPQLEILPRYTTPEDVLEQGPLHCVDCGLLGWKLYWSSCSYHLKEVNEVATSLASQLVKGDACLVHHSPQQHMLDDLLQSRHWGRARHRGLRSPPHTQRDQAHCGSSPQQQLLHLHTRKQSLSDDHAKSRCSRSLQRIAAANNTRDRILHGMSSTGTKTQQQELDCNTALQQFPNEVLPPQLAVDQQCCISPSCNSNSSISHNSSCTYPTAIGSDTAGFASSSQLVPSAAAPAPVSAVTPSSSPSSQTSSAAAAAPSPAPPPPPPCSPPPPWDDLSQDVVARVAGWLGSSTSAVMPVYSTCRSWRSAVLDDDQLLAGLHFHLDPCRPFKQCDHSHPAAATSWPHWQQISPRQQHPALLQRASKLNNVSALVCRARLLDAVGSVDEAMRMWRSAAKCGDVEGQLVLGLALYRGTAGLAQDPEDAHIWLSKAWKQVNKSSNTNSSVAHSSDNSSTPAGHSQSGVTSDTGTTHSSSNNNDSAASNSRSSSSRVRALRSRVQAQAGLVLGYLCFDGEGTRTDKSEAVKYFKQAAAAGWGKESREAAQVLGWIWNTGQY